jgi:hypothetical protein
MKWIVLLVLYFFLTGDGFEIILLYIYLQAGLYGCGYGRIHESCTRESFDGGRGSGVGSGERRSAPAAQRVNNIRSQSKILPPMPIRNNFSHRVG